MNKIPTAEEYLNGRLGKDQYPTDASDTLIDFAKLHVIAALKAANKNAYCSMEHPDENNDLEESDYIVNKDSILDAYPLTNIV